MNHPDHEIEMARSELYSIAKYAMALHEMLENVSELEGMEGWQQSKITKAADYMESVYQSITHEMKFGVAENTNSPAYQRVELYNQGRKAGLSGKGTNPYGDPDDSREAYFWQEGYEDGQILRSKGVAEGDYPNDPFREIHSQGQQAGIAGKPNNNPYGEPGDSKEASYWDDGYELGLQIRRKRTGVAEAGRGSNKGYAPGFASPTAPPLRPVGGPKQDDEYVNGGPVNNIEVSINDRPWKIFPGKGPDGSKAFFQQKQDVDEMCKRKTAATGKKWSWGVTGDPATNESVEENKKGVRAVKHTTKPRNPVMAGDKPGKATVTHKNKKKDAERGIEKHKGKEPAYESRLWNALSQHLEK